MTTKELCLNVDINAKNNSGESLLMTFAKRDDMNYDPAIIHYLLKNFPNLEINDKNENGDTALMLAVKNGKLNNASYLLKGGDCDINTKDNEGIPLLSYAARQAERLYDWKIVGKLLHPRRKDIPDFNATDKKGITPFMEMIKVSYRSGDSSYNNYSAITDALHAGADVDAKSADGKTALMMACDAKEEIPEEIIQILLRESKKNDVEKKHDIEQALKLATNNNYHRTADILSIELQRIT